MYNLETMLVVGHDLAAIVRAAVRKDTVRKRGLRGSDWTVWHLRGEQTADFSATPIEGIPPHAEIDVYLNKITVAGSFTPGIISPATAGYVWSEVVIAEDDLRQFLAHYYDLLPQQSANEAVQEAPAKRRVARVDYREADAPLVAEGVAGVLSGKYRNATHAGNLLAEKARGARTPASKGSRLARAIKAKLDEL